MADSLNPAHGTDHPGIEAQSVYLNRRFRRIGYDITSTLGVMHIRQSNTRYGGPAIWRLAGIEEPCVYWGNAIQKLGLPKKSQSFSFYSSSSKILWSTKFSRRQLHRTI